MLYSCSSFHTSQTTPHWTKANDGQGYWRAEPTCRASLSSAIATTSTSGCVRAGKADRTEVTKLAADSRVCAPSKTSRGPWKVWQGQREKQSC
eukprot:scaffold15192_cov15-Tisochrysis_lutea.AAC.1